MKPFLSLLTALVLSLTVHAQSAPIYPDWKQWSDGPLTLSDFQSRFAVSQYRSALMYGMTTTTDTIRLKGMSPIVKMRPVVYADTTQSWIRRDAFNEATLRYNQLKFDILEKNRRMLLRDLAATTDGIRHQQLYEQYFHRAEKEIGDLDESSNYGQREDVIESIASLTASKLSSLPIQEGLQDFQYSRKFGIGIFIGYSPIIFSGQMGQHFAPFHTLYIGFNNVFGRSHIYVDDIVGGSRTLNDFYHNGYWPKDSKSNLAMFDLCYGYSVLDKPRLSITPIAGVAYWGNGLTNDDDEADVDAPDTNNLGIMAGIEGLWKFKRDASLDQPFATCPSSIVEFYLKARLAYAVPVFKADLTGNALTLSVAIGYDIRSLKPKNQ